jgi:hypothetical protein
MDKVLSPFDIPYKKPRLKEQKPQTQPNHENDEQIKTRTYKKIPKLTNGTFLVEYYYYDSSETVKC